MTIPSPRTPLPEHAAPNGVTYRLAHPTQLPERWRWAEAALCRSVDPELWFSQPNTVEHRDAIEMCGHCPVAGNCLTDVLAIERTGAASDIHGVAGGLTAKQRRKLARHHGRMCIHCPNPVPPRSTYCDACAALQREESRRAYEASKESA